MKNEKKKERVSHQEKLLAGSEQTPKLKKYKNAENSVRENILKFVYLLNLRLHQIISRALLKFHCWQFCSNFLK